jgi:hypothetical protein
MSAAAAAIAPLGSRNRGLAIAAAVIAAVALAGLLFVAIGPGGSADQTSPRSADGAELRELSSVVGHDVFWAGAPAAGESIELTDQPDGRVFVRYLSGGAEVGDSRADYTTIGTYPVRNPLASLRREARGPDAITRDLPGGGFAYLSLDQPTSVHLAWPGSSYEVEVYDPSPKRALDLVLSGAVQPVR